MTGPERAVGGLSVRPPAGVELRPAARDDLAAVLGLLDERHGDATSRPDADEAARRWNELIGSVDAVPFAAEIEGQMAGVVLLWFRRRLNFATWEGWVPELVVAREFRGRGLGRALLRVAIEEWRLRGAHRLSVEVAGGEGAGVALLAGLGFEDTFVRFSQDPIHVSGVEAVRDLAMRPLSVDDFGETTRLVAEMGPHRSPVPERMEAVERSFREIVERPNMASLVATRDGIPVGLCTLEIRETLWESAPEAWIPELVVTEPQRGQGIGRALLGAALSTATDRGAGRAVLESGWKRETAQRLYRSFGFQEAGSVFTLLRDR